jgi:hypothetical protein
MRIHVHRYARLVLGVVGIVVGLTLPTAAAQGPFPIQPPLKLIRAGSRNIPSLVPPIPKSRPGVGPSAAMINVTYNGFTDDSRAAFQYAVDIWASQITSPIPIEVNATWEPLGAGVLGAAGPDQLWANFDADVRPNLYYPVALANKLAERDVNPDRGDINAFFSSSFGNWYFGTDGNTPPGMYDFVSIVLHELGHGLGFSGSMRVQSGQGSWGYGTGYPSIYDVFAENGTGSALLNTSFFPNPSVALGRQLTSNNIFWDGPTARTAAGGSPPRLYAPSFWQSGSSYSHLDEAAYGAGDPNSLMTPQIGQAEAIHDPGPIARGMFTDLGWTVQEPQQPRLDGQLELDGGAIYTRDAQLSATITNRSTAVGTGYALRDGSEPSMQDGVFSHPVTAVLFNLDTSDEACRLHTIYGKLFDARRPSPTFTDAITYDPNVEASLQPSGMDRDRPGAPDPLYTQGSTYRITYEAAANECSGLADLTISYQRIPSGGTPVPLTRALGGTSGSVSAPFPLSAAEGTYEFQVNVRDHAGNERTFPSAGTYQLVIDRTAPEARLGTNNTAPTQESIDGVAILNLRNLTVQDNLYPTMGGAHREYWGYRVLVKKTTDGVPSVEEWQQRSVKIRGQTTRLTWNLASGMVGQFVPEHDYVVYVDFLDGAGNVSTPIKSEPLTVQELRGPRVFMPLIKR